MRASTSHFGGPEGSFAGVGRVLVVRRAGGIGGVGGVGVVGVVGVVVSVRTRNNIKHTDGFRGREDKCGGGVGGGEACSVAPPTGKASVLAPPLLRLATYECVKFNTPAEIV